MLLTNMLPDQGNGTFVFHVWITDREGHTVWLGSRTMTCANAAATRPFGSIDTPTQGGVASGTGFVNFGWALTPQPKIIPIDGSTITVLIDGVAQGTVSYNHERPDIESLFPGFRNTAGTNGAVGFRIIDTTRLTNGLHTISWTVVDDHGAVEGIGSRYFTVSNGVSAGTAAAEGAASARVTADAEAIAAATRADTAVVGRRGWDLAGQWQRYGLGSEGRATDPRGRDGSVRSAAGYTERRTLYAAMFAWAARWRRCQSARSWTRRQDGSPGRPAWASWVHTTSCSRGGQERAQ